MPDNDEHSQTRIDPQLVFQSMTRAVFPPWRIPPFDEQVRASATVIFVCAILLMLVRVFTPYNNPLAGVSGFLASFATSVIPIIVAIAVGLATPPRSRAALGQWMNFLAVSFLLSLILLLAILWLIPNVFLLNQGISDYIVDIFNISHWQAFFIICVLVSSTSILILYFRKICFFRGISKDNSAKLIAAFIFCDIALSAILYFGAYHKFA